jgi:hypothetical protein
LHGFSDLLTDQDLTPIYNQGKTKWEVNMIILDHKYMNFDFILFALIFDKGCLVQACPDATAFE